MLKLALLFELTPREPLWQLEALNITNYKLESLLFKPGSMANNNNLAFSNKN